MRKFIQKFTIWLFSLSLLIVLFSFIHIPNQFIYKKFENTQYNKINWFLQKIENGEFKEKKYKGVFFGSSQCYYGINDSILGPDYLNLGMNTPSRDMDYYMYETFIKNGGIANQIYFTTDGFTKVSFGLHPLLPYLVSPSWLLRNGQTVFSYHFIKFVLMRSQILLESLVSFNKSDILFSKRIFGVGYLSKRTKREQPDFYDKTNLDQYNLYTEVDFYEKVRLNLGTQWNFFNKISNYNFLLLPSFLDSTSSKKFNKNFENDTSFEKKIAVDLKMLGDLFYQPKYWADPGHLNRQGAIRFSIALKHQLTNQ